MNIYLEEEKIHITYLCTILWRQYRIRFWSIFHSIGENDQLEL